VPQIYAITFLTFQLWSFDNDADVVAGGVDISADGPVWAAVWEPGRSVSSDGGHDVCVVDIDYTAEPGRCAHAGSRRRGRVSATADDDAVSLSLSLSPCVCICLCVFWYLSMFVYFRQSCIHVYAVVPLLVPLMFNTVACYMLRPVSVSMFSACLLQVGVVLKRHNFRSCKQHHSSSGTLVFWCQSANWNSLFSVACSSFSRLV